MSTRRNRPETKKESEKEVKRSEGGKQNTERQAK